MKNALIIGGSGGLSSVVARLAMNSGYNVWAITRGKRSLPEGVTGIIADRNDEIAFENAVLATGLCWDVVFDCICMNSRHAEQDLCVISKVSNRLVVVSTDSVYDPAHKATPQTEEGVFLEEEGTDEEVSYGCNKRRMEVVFEHYMRNGAVDARTNDATCARENGETSITDSGLHNGTTLLNITIFRPGHIYGPGFLLGCFPENSRRRELPELILAEKPLRLVGLGTYLIQPVYVDDLARVMVECAENEKTFNRFFCIGGPAAIENRCYYECIASALGRKLYVEEVPLQGYVERHPEFAGHLCHRIYDLSSLRETGVRLPDTHIEEGIREHLRSLGYLTND